MDYNRRRLQFLPILTYMFLFFMVSRAYTIEFIRTNDLLATLYARASVLVCLAFVVYYIGANRGRFLLENIKALLLLLLYAFMLLGVTLIRGGSLRQWLSGFYPIIASFCLFDYATKRHRREFIAAMAFLMYGLVVINLLDALLFKDTSEMYSTAFFFLGGRNQLGIPLVLGMAFVKLYADQELAGRKAAYRLFAWGYMAIAVLSAIVLRSATTIVSTAVMIFLYLFQKNRLVNWVTSPKRYLVIYGLIWAGLVILRLHERAADLIAAVLHRSATLTDRTLIWDVALEQIGKRPLFGYGIPYDGNLFAIIRPSTGIEHAFSAHNELVQQLYEGGLVMLLIFIIFYLACTGKKRARARGFRYFFNIAIVISIIWLTEAPGRYGMYIALGLCFYANQFDSPLPIRKQPAKTELPTLK